MAPLSCTIQPGSILLTEADAELKALFEAVYPRTAIAALDGTLDLSLVGERDSVQALCVTVRSPVGKAEMDALPDLRIVATGSVGYDHIDRSEARRRGIVVCNVPEYGAAVAEFNIALMLMLSRKLHVAYLQTFQRDFSLSCLMGRNLYGRTLGVIGTGNIGMRVAQLASALGLSVVAVDPAPRPREFVRYVLMDDLLATSDIIAMCCPLTPETTHLIGKPEFALMKRGVLIVNTSRGAVLDTHALLWALNEDIVDGAALDVLEGEALLPPTMLVPTLAREPSSGQLQDIAQGLTLIRHPKVIVTPHMAYYTSDSLDRIRRATVENVQAFFAGKPQNVC